VLLVLKPEPELFYVITVCRCRRAIAIDTDYRSEVGLVANALSPRFLSLFCAKCMMEKIKIGGECSVPEVFIHFLQQGLHDDGNRDMIYYMLVVSIIIHGYF